MYDNYLITSLISFILVDFLVLFITYWIIKKKEEKNILIVVLHDRRWYNLTSKSLSIITLIGVLLFLFFVVKVDNINTAGIIIPAYIILSKTLFYNGFDGYIMDKSGIIQPDLWVKDYTWNDIGEMKIDDQSIRYLINSKVYKTRIDKSQIPKIVSFLKTYSINYSA